MLGGSVFRGGGAAQHLHGQIRTRFTAARLLSVPSRVHRPLRHVSANNCGARSPAGAGLLGHRLFRGYDLVHVGPFSLCIIALLIGLVQELVDVVEGGLEIHNDAGTNSTLIANACVVVSLDIA